MPAHTHNTCSIHRLLLAFALIGICVSAFGQSLPPAQAPGAASQLRQVPTPQALPAAPPQIRVIQGAAPAAQASDTTRIPVLRLVVDAPLFPEAELVAASGFEPGSVLTLSDLRALAARIATFYHVRGYFLAQAYLPAQDIADGVVRINVLAGYYGKVSVRDAGVLAEGVADATLAGLQGQAITAAPLERRLLLLADLPGVQASSTLVPGSTPGTSDLLVDLARGERISGSIDADNEGNRYTGRNRIGATVSVNELAGLGDTASLRAFTSADGLNYARASYQAQAGATRLGAAYTALDYRLGKEFASLDANGTARIASAYASYPVIRSRSANLYLQLNVDAKHFRDKANATGSVSDKDARVWMLNLNGDARDGWAGGGASTVSLSATSGEIMLRSPAALLLDQVGAGINGHFSKLGVSASRLQNIAADTQFYAAFSGQLASGNLDVSEKFGLGGAGGVRAYPGGEADADQGYVINLELRHALAAPTLLGGQLQGVAFADSGAVTLNHTPFAAGQNRRTLSGAGLGLNWTNASGLSVKATYAHKLGNAKAVSVPDANSRFWLQAIKFF